MKMNMNSLNWWRRNSKSLNMLLTAVKKTPRITIKLYRYWLSKNVDLFVPQFALLSIECLIYQHWIYFAVVFFVRCFRFCPLSTVAAKSRQFCLLDSGGREGKKNSMTLQLHNRIFRLNKFDINWFNWYTCELCTFRLKYLHMRDYRCKRQRPHSFKYSCRSMIQL